MSVSLSILIQFHQVGYPGGNDETSLGRRSDSHLAVQYSKAFLDPEVPLTIPHLGFLAFPIIHHKQ